MRPIPLAIPTALVSYALCVAPSFAATNLLVNGDFETTSIVGCALNVSDATLAAGMPGVISVGAADEIDVLNNSGGCGFLGAPASGQVKLALMAYPGGPSDGVSLALSSTLLEAVPYRLSFQAWDYQQSFAPGPSRIGAFLTTGAVIGGTYLGALMPAADGWHTYSYEFVAPADVDHVLLGVAGPDATSWLHIDDVRVELVDATPSVRRSWGAVKSRYR